MDNLGDADPMLGLFDTDNFLDELTGPSVSSSMSTGMGMGDPGVGGLQAGPFNQTPMQQPTQKLHHYDDFHSMNASNPFGTPGPTMNVAQSQQGSMLNSSPQQQQFNNQGHMQSPPAASSGFPQYSMHNNSHMNQTPQLAQSQAQMGMNRQMGQMNQWNQGAQGVQNQAYAGQQQGTQYLSHHDYALPKSNNQGQGSQRLSHFPEQQNQANFNASAPPMGSPPSTNRLTHMPMANTEPHVAMNGPAHSMPGQGHAGYQAPPQGNMMVPGQTQPLRHPQLNSGQPISGGQVNASQMSASAKLQHFNYQQQQQQQLQQQGNPNMMSQQNVNEAPPLTHMPPQSPNQTTQYRQPYPGMSPRPTPSPRLTTPPPSHTPTGMSSYPASSQGSYGHGQGMQQMGPQNVPHSGSIPNSSYNTMQQNAGSGLNAMSMNQNMAQQRPPSVGHTYGNHAGQQSTNVAPMGQQSPNMGNAMGNNMQPDNVTMEINKLSGQVQQLYNMPQTPETQQKMLDLQEKVRTLKAQQQQQILQQQRQQAQMQQKQILGQAAGAAQAQTQVVTAPQQTGFQNQTRPQLAAQPVPQQNAVQRVVRPVQGQGQPQIRHIRIQQQPGQQPRKQTVQIRQLQPGQQIKIAPQPAGGQQIQQIQIRGGQVQRAAQPQQLPKLQLTGQPINQSGQVQQIRIQIVQPQNQQDQKGTTQPVQIVKQGEIRASAPAVVTTQQSLLISKVNPAQSQSLLVTPVSQTPQKPATVVLTTANAQNLNKPISKEQEKANNIIAEAIAKAQAQGKDVPRVVTPPPKADGTAEETADGKPAKKGKGRARPKKDKKDTPKGKKTPAKNKKKKPKEGEEENDESTEVDVETDDSKKPTPAKAKAKTPAKAKSSAKKKKLPPATFLQNKKRKRKNSSGSEYGGDASPTPVPEDESLIEKRRSGRNTKRKKYLDELELDLSDENGDVDVTSEAPAPIAAIKNVSFFVDNPNEDEAQIVEKILGMRIGKRAIEQPDVEDVEVEVTDTQEKKEVNDVKNEESKEVKGEKTDENMDVEVEDKKEDMEEKKEAEDKSDNGETAVEKEEVNTTVAANNASPEKNIATEPKKESPLKKEETMKNGKPVEYIEVEEFFVKYKNFSYLHCEWKTAEELERGDKRIHRKIKTYRQKRLQANNYFQQVDEDELFNPDYAEVDRILEVSSTPDPDTNVLVTHYLVKWRGLPYEDSTWELETDVDKSKIEAFNKFREPPPEDEREIMERPESDEWERLEESRVYKNGNTLREYQLEGVNWLTFCYYNKQNCILADEMGLGKTIQSITFIQEVIHYGIKGPYLVIVPLSTIGNWQREFETWTDINVIVYHGSSPSRNMLQEYEMYYKDENGLRIPDIYKFQVMITTFEIIISDCELLSEIEWRLTIIDEAHRLKNKNCRLLEGLKMFQLEHRVLLTGTPLQNNVQELFSLLNFLEPKQFCNHEAFNAEFGDLKTETQVGKLKAILKPMMLRRLKEDVEKNLAAKEETIIEVELTNIQKKYYRAILEKNFSFLAKGGSTSNIPSLMNTMMELRKCCNHPYLITGAEEQIMHETKVQHEKMTDFERHFHALVQSSGKLVLVDKLLPKLKAGNHKVLIFSQMIRVLDIIEDYLITKGYLFERIDGRIRGNLRQEAIDRFSKPESDRFVFLLCTRAGGLGINLTAADTVIIYDSDWNPQNDLQAQARCHRIGQTKEVKVYRLITRNSYEREMFDKASLKLGLDKAVLQSMGQKESGGPPNQMSKKEIEQLLKKGAYGAIMDDDKEGDQFCEEDIDQILQRRTQIIQIESEGKGSTFAKASFSMSSSRSDIDIDDPNFWQKWAKKADVDVDALNNKNDLIIEMPRKRKQTARYGNQDMVENMSELDTSDSDDDSMKAEKRGRGRPGRKKRRGLDDDEFGDLEDGPVDGVYHRGEFFKVEKNLLIYGWGRWSDILAHGRFKRRLEASDVETIAKALLLYSLKHYKGDERIKQFILDLCTQSGDGQNYKNHIGLSAPVPRGRKGRKAKEPSQLEATLDQDIAKASIDPEAIIRDEGYKKHLHRHSNKVLLRVRLLYYLKQEVIGGECSKVFSNLPASQIHLPTPGADGEPPIYWWDREADKSLLIGVYKHGYEKYNVIRSDPTLCFLSRCGPPDSKDLQMEQNDEDNDKEDEDDSKPSKSKGKKDDLDNELSPGSPGSEAPPKAAASHPMAADGEKLPFPGPSELNTRLRRIITGYQRNHKREQIKTEQKAKKMEKREKFEAVLKEREFERRRQQQRWTRREEAEFYRVASTFGVERDRRTGAYNWSTFKTLSRLERKFDETMTEYFKSFYHMLMSVCKKFKEDEEIQPPTMYVEPITEERANRTLARLDLLTKIREEILWHPKLEERVKMCQTSPEMPDWWECGIHDKELLIGAAKHGLSRTDYHIQNDPKLVFREAMMKASIKREQELQKMEENGQTESVISPKKEIETKAEKGEEEGQEALDLVKKEEVVKSESDAAEETEKKDETDSPVKEVKKEVEDVKKEEDTSNKETNEKEGEKASPMKESAESEEKKVEDAKEGEEGDKEEKGETIEEKKEVCEKSPVKEEKKSPVKAEGSPPKDAEEKDVKESEEESKQKDSDTPVAKQETDATESMDETLDQNEINALKSISSTGPIFSWPKDRIIFHRLENICHTIEHGEWPAAAARKFTRELLQRGDLSDSRSSTPAPGTPLSDSYSVHDYSLESGGRLKGDGLKLTFHKKQRGRPRMDFEDSFYGISDADSAADSESNLSFRDTLMNGSDTMDSPFRRDEDSGTDGMDRQLEPGEVIVRKKRGRKRKIDKLLEAAHGNRISMFRRPALDGIDPETRIPMICLKDGSRLSGERAPMKKELDRWLDQHPDYMVDRPNVEDELAEMGIILNTPTYAGPGRRRVPRVDPYKVTPDELTGDENVSVINRETGKKITGAKAPPLKYLAQWLEKNPAFDVEPKWGPLVKARGKIPEKLQSRVLMPSGRGRKPNAQLASAALPSEYAYPSVSSMNALASLASSGMMAYNKMPLSMAAFGGLPGFGFAANPMYGMTSLNMMANAMKVREDEEEEEKISKKSSSKEEKKEKKDSKDSEKNSTPKTPHNAFPFMAYNPLLYNPLFAQGLQGFNLPTSLPTSFASLAQAHQSGALNGLEMEEKETPPSKRSSSKPMKAHSSSKKSSRASESMAEDLSMKNTSPESMPEDLSKKKSHSTPEVSKKKKRIDMIAQDLSLKKTPSETEKVSPLKLVKSSKSNELKVQSVTKSPGRSLDKTIASLKAHTAASSKHSDLTSPQRLQKSIEKLMKSAEKSSSSRAAPSDRNMKLVEKIVKSIEKEKIKQKKHSPSKDTSEEISQKLPSKPESSPEKVESPPKKEETPHESDDAKEADEPEDIDESPESDKEDNDDDDGEEEP